MHIHAQSPLSKFTATINDTDLMLRTDLEGAIKYKKNFHLRVSFKNIPIEIRAYEL